MISSRSHGEKEEADLEHLDFDSLVDIQMNELPLHSDEHLLLAHLGRIPTWDELFFAIHQAVSDYKKPYFSFGNSMFAVPLGEDKHGRCAMYAGVAWSFISTFFKIPCGIAVGGIRIQCKDEPDAFISLPSDHSKINPYSGGYHAWVGFQHEGSDYFVDMAYHWFQTHHSVVGPKHYLVSSPEKLVELNIIYHSDLRVASLVDMCSDITNFEELSVAVLLTLQDITNDR